MSRLGRLPEPCLLIGLALLSFAAIDGSWAVAAGPANAAPQLEARIKLARQYRQAGQAAAAQGEYETLLKTADLSDRQRLAITLERGHAWLEAGDYRAARAAYAAVAADPAAPAYFKSQARLQTALSHALEGNAAAAKAEYQRLAESADAPEHHRWEARERAEELDRMAKGLPPRDAKASRAPPVSWPTPGVEFWVSPSGADTVAGSRQQPFATLQRARDEIRAINRQGSLPAGGVTVWIRGGVYPVQQTFTLGAEDSGTAVAPVVYCAVEGERPVFSGGVAVKNFTPVRDAAILARLPESARGKVLQADLRAQGITEFGRFEPGGYGSGSGFATRPMLELFCNGAAMPLARWPNDGYVVVGELRGREPFEQRFRLAGNREGKFTYDSDRPARWKDERDAWLYGYWFWDWADSYEKIAAIDTQQRTIALAPPYHRMGFRKGQRYYAVNLLCEIDAPGEWHLDRAAGILYFYPPCDLARAVVEVSMWEKPMVQMDQAVHVRFRGLTWQLGRGDGLLIRGGERCLLAGCTVRQFAGDAAVISGTGHEVRGCDLHTLGRGGIALSGGDRKTLARAENLVENCHIYDVSRIHHTYTPMIKLDGVGSRIAHNLMHHGGSSALRLGGNDHLVEWNEVHDVVRDSDDQGGVDMHGNPSFRGNVFRYNLWHDIGNRLGTGQAGIRFDDAISGQLVYGNVFYRCSEGHFGGVQIHGGKDNVVDNNLFVDCKYAISFSAWGEKRWRETLAQPEMVKRLTREIDIGRPPYSTRYPQLARLAEDADVNFLWRNLAIGCGQLTARDRGVQQTMDNWATDQQAQVADPQRLDFRLRDAPLWQRRIGWRPIPLQEIGLYEDPLRATPPRD